MGPVAQPKANQRLEGVCHRRWRADRRRAVRRTPRGVAAPGRSAALGFAGEAPAALRARCPPGRRRSVPSRDSPPPPRRTPSPQVDPCPRPYAHDWAACACGHVGERAARRSVQAVGYRSTACPYAKKKLPCPDGDQCLNAHNLFEYWWVESSG